CSHCNAPVRIDGVLDHEEGVRADEPRSPLPPIGAERRRPLVREDEDEDAPPRPSSGGVALIVILAGVGGLVLFGGGRGGLLLGVSSRPVAAPAPVAVQTPAPVAQPEAPLGGAAAQGGNAPGISPVRTLTPGYRSVLVLRMDVCGPKPARAVVHARERARG